MLNQDDEAPLQQAIVKAVTPCKRWAGLCRDGGLHAYVNMLICKAFESIGNHLDREDCTVMSLTTLYTFVFSLGTLMPTECQSEYESAQLFRGKVLPKLRLKQQVDNAETVSKPWLPSRRSRTTTSSMIWSTCPISWTSSTKTMLM